MRVIYLITSLLAVAILFIGCVASPVELKGSERESVLSYSEPMADNMLNALNSNDYQSFIKDYDEKMIEATTAENYSSLHSLLSNKLGKYLSREVSAVSVINNDAILVIYTAKFEKEEGVTIRLVFQPGGEHRITGLWFDSSKLREKNPGE